MKTNTSNGNDEPESDQPAPETIDFSSDSVRLLSNGERVKCMVIMDVTLLTEEQRMDFLNRSLAALTRMGEKLMKRRTN